MSSGSAPRALPKELSFSSDAVALRNWRMSDAPALASVCGDPDVCLFSTVPWEYSRSSARQWVERQWRRRESGDGLVLAVARPGEARALGMVCLNFGDRPADEAGLGYWLVPEARGAGLATAATRALCDYGFGQLGLTRIELAVEPGNRGSERLIERLGAVAAGTAAVTVDDVTYDLQISELAPPAVSRSH